MGLTEKQQDAFRLLRILGRTYGDVQHARIMVSNRSRGLHELQQRSTILSEEGSETGLKAVEAKVGKNMEIAFKHVPPGIVAWQDRSVGVGKLTVARLLGEIGHPRIATPHRWEGTGEDRKLIELPSYPRSLGQLLAYCGHGDPTRRPQRGMSADELFKMGSPEAKKIVYLMATGVLKQNQPDQGYRVFYDDARRHYLAKTHALPCKRCGPAGHPAKTGTPWSKGHQHAAGLRLLGKRLLRDLWIAAG